MKLQDIILEVNYNPYRAMVRVISRDTSPSVLADIIRALPGVTTCTIASSDADRNLTTFKIKIISQKQPKEAFIALKKNALSKYSEINVFDIGFKTIERMKKPGEY